MKVVGAQVLVATSTLAWGVNTPAHLVVIKGTEFFDAPTRHVSASCSVVMPQCHPLTCLQAHAAPTLHFTRKCGSCIMADR